jgi:hypothetical protein
VILKAELQASAGVVGPGGPIVGQTVTRTAKEELRPVEPERLREERGRLLGSRSRELGY